MPFARLQASHVMSTTPAAGATLTNAGSRTTGGMENIGTATSETFTMTETMTCTETVNVPITSTPVPVVSDGLDIILFPISITRFEAQKAKIELEKQGYKIGIANIVWIKPFTIKKEWEKAIISSKFGGIVLDDDYAQGVATNLAYEMMKKTKKKIDVMGLKNKSAGFSKMTDNLPPNYLDITEKVKELVKANKKL